MRVAVIRKLGVLALLVASAAQCGPAGPELAGTLSERTVGRLTQAPRVYASSAPGAVTTTDTAALATTFENALEPRVRLRIRHDAALDLAAAALAENFSDQGKSASSALAQWLLWRTGSVAIYRGRAGGFNGGSRGREHTNLRSLDTWATQAAEQLNAAPGGTLSYGLARLKEGKVTAESIVFASAPFVVAPFSKTYAPGGPLTLALHPLVPFTELRVSIGSESAVEEEALAPRADGSFFLSRAVPSKPGRYFVEIQGPPPARHTLLSVPIYVGVLEPTEPDDFIQHPPAGPSDVAGWQAWLAAKYDAERAKVGRGPVEIDARFTALATGRNPVGAFTLVDGTDAVFLDLLRPSVRKRLILSARVLFGAAASARPGKENLPPSFAVFQEMETPEPVLPASAASPSPPAPPAPPATGSP